MPTDCREAIERFVSISQRAKSANEQPLKDRSENLHDSLKHLRPSIVTIEEVLKDKKSDIITKKDENEAALEKEIQNLRQALAITSSRWTKVRATS